MSVTKETVEQVLVLELMVKGHVMDEVTFVQLLPQKDGIRTSYREGNREHLGRGTGRER